MAKKTREELIAEANKPVPQTDSEPDAPLSPEAQAEADRIMNQTEEEVLALEETIEESSAVSEKQASGEAAASKLRTLLGGYSPSAPNEHICFGNGAGRFTLGDLRDLVAIIPPR